MRTGFDGFDFAGDGCVHGRRDKSAGFGNKLPLADAVAFFDECLRGCADVLADRQHDFRRKRCGCNWSILGELLEVAGVDAAGERAFLEFGEYRH